MATICYPSVAGGDNRWSRRLFHLLFTRNYQASPLHAINPTACLYIAILAILRAKRRTTGAIAGRTGNCHQITDNAIRSKFQVGGDMAILRQSRRRFLQTGLGAGAALFTPGLIRPARAQAPAAEAPDLGGLRDKIEHIVVIFQENRAFDHYFGTYQSPSGAKVNNLLDAEGKIDQRFLGLQKNPAGAPYPFLPLPYNIPGFAEAQLPNMPFPMAKYIPADSNVLWDPMHHFFRMFAQVNGGKMDRFVALALGGKHEFFDKPSSNPADMMMAESTPSGAVVGYYTRADLPFYHHLADEYVLCDNFFQAMSGGSTGNALYLVSARSAVSSKAPTAKIGSLDPPVFDRPYDKYGILINDLPPVNGPTETFMGSLDLAPPPEEQTYPNIGDRLADASLSWAWYNDAWNAVKPWAMKNAFGAGDGSVVVDTPWHYLSHHNPFQYYPSWFRMSRQGAFATPATSSRMRKRASCPTCRSSRRRARVTSTPRIRRRAGARTGCSRC
jgi:Phosphoesterase family